MTFLEFETDLVKELKNIGWIDSYTADRQDSYILWTKLGKSMQNDFLKNVRKIYNIDNNVKEKYLISFGHYHGIIEKTEKEEIISKISPFITEKDFLVIVRSDKGNKSYFLFDSLDNDNLIEVIKNAKQNKDEIMFIEMNALIKSNVGKITPFGKKEFKQE